MSVDDDTSRWLNLLRSSPTFVVVEGDRGLELKSISLIPAGTGLYWVAGKSTLASNRELDSVFVVDSGAGGELVRAFWFIDSQWIESTDTAAVESGGLTREEVFPFDWRLAIPLEDDAFHSPS